LKILKGTNSAHMILYTYLYSMFNRSLKPNFKVFILATSFKPDKQNLSKGRTNKNICLKTYIIIKVLT